MSEPRIRSTDDSHEQYDPTISSIVNPVLKALKALGGSGSVKEINDKVIGTLDLPSEALEKLHNPETGNETEIEYRLAWARTYLKKYGLIDNSSRGVWALTKKAEAVHEVNADEVVKSVRGTSRQDRQIERRASEEGRRASRRGRAERTIVACRVAQDPDQGAGAGDLRKIGSKTAPRIGVHPGRGHGPGGRRRDRRKGNRQNSWLDELPCYLSMQAISRRRLIGRDTRLPWCHGREVGQGALHHDRFLLEGRDQGSNARWSTSDRSGRWRSTRGKTQGVPTGSQGGDSREGDGRIRMVQDDLNPRSAAQFKPAKEDSQ